jgi:hypothetical protein
MKKRERNMIIITLAVVALVLALNFLLGDKLETSEESVSSGNLDSARETYNQYKQALKDSAKTKAAYQAIAFSQPERIPGQDPGETFQNQLSRLLIEQLRVPNPQVGTPKATEIKNVEDYYFINIDVHISGTHPELMQLLVNMQRLGLLIQSFTLKQQNKMQWEAIDMDITVARLVKHDADSKKRLSWKRVRR